MATTPELLEATKNHLTPVERLAHAEQAAAFGRKLADTRLAEIQAAVDGVTVARETNTPYDPVIVLLQVKAIIERP